VLRKCDLNLVLTCFDTIVPIYLRCGPCSCC